MNNKKINIISLENSNSQPEERLMELLNAVETAILFYGRQHQMIGNPYWWFSGQLGYKSKNFLYGIFQKREHHKLTTDAVSKVYQITKDEQLKQVWLRFL